MSERIAFPPPYRGCARWRQHGHASVTLLARPACAGLAMALADGMKQPPTREKPAVRWPLFP
ncbi:hypothetical protein BH10PSE13_BH10PSE13_12480 [soil metagenome]